MDNDDAGVDSVARVKNNVTQWNNWALQRHPHKRNGIGGSKA